MVVLNLPTCRAYCSITLFAFFFMYSKTIRAGAVNRALAAAAVAPTSSELNLLTRYVLGYLTLERTNELLRSLGRRLCVPTHLPASSKVSNYSKKMWNGRSLVGELD